MYTSDREKAVEYSDKLLFYAFICLAVSLFCALFGAVYEMFSHGVYSFFMIYAFAIPLSLGAFPLMALSLHAKRRAEKKKDIDPETAELPYEENGRVMNPGFFFFPGRIALNAWFSGIATLTVGSLIRGVLEIYGTTNRLAAVYPAAGTVLLAAGLAAFLIPVLRH